MLVSNNSLLNILLPNDNKVLKDVLKEADSKTLQQMVNNKSTSVNDILKNLFDQVKNGAKSNSNIENILKNSNLFKDLGSFSKSLTSVLNQIDSNSNLAKYKPLLQSFLKDIKDLDANSLKEQLGKSGVFLESKIAQQNLGKNAALPNNILKLLNQIQNAVKELNLPQSKQINELVTKLLQAPQQNQNSITTASNNTATMKSLVSLLQNLNTSLSTPGSKNIANLTNQLKSLINNASLVESKINNTSMQENLNTQSKQLLTQIKNEITANPAQQMSSKNLLSQIDTLVKSNDLFTKGSNNLEVKPALNNLLNSPEVKLASSQNQNISNLVSNLKNTLLQANIDKPTVNSLGVVKEQINNQTKELLSQIKNEVLTIPKQLEGKSILNQIDNLLKSNDLFTKNDKLIEPKNLLNNLLNSSEIKQASSQNPNISNLVLNLKNISDEITTVQNKTLNMQNVGSEKATLTTNLKENLANLKNELLNTKNIDTKAANQIISKLENIQNIFTKVEVPGTSMQQSTQNTQNTNIGNFPNNFANNLNNLLLTLKESITNLSINQGGQNNLNTQNQILNVVDKIETTIKENLSMQNINPTTNPALAKNEANPLSNDMKSVLLQMQDELASKGDGKSQEIFKQVDKMLTQIDYHQLMSFTANSNYVYVPFFWDMLEDGTINMKKADEDKFYCQINLTLKDFGKVDLMLALYDKNKLDLTIKTQREHAKEDFRNNIQKLKQNLNSVDLIPVNIKLLDLKEETDVQEKKTQSYENTYNEQIGSSLDIRA